MQEPNLQENNSTESNPDINFGLYTANALVQKTYTTTTIAFSPNGQLLASKTSEHEIRIIDATKNVFSGTLSSAGQKVSCIAFSPDAQILAGGTFDGEILFWDVESLDRTKMFFGHTSAIVGVAFSPDGHVLVSSSRDGTIRFWNLLVDECFHIFEFSQRENVVQEVVLSSSNPQTLPLKHLTPKYLEDSVNPYLLALSEVQNIINSIRNLSSQEVSINFISQNSPIQVSFEGANQAISLIRNTVVPWRRKHAKNMARLAEKEKFIEIEIKRFEISEKHIQAEKEKVEVSKQREEVEKLRLENEKLRQELQREKIQLALDMLNMVSPNLAEQDKIGYVVKLLSPLDILTNSNLEIVNR